MLQISPVNSNNVSFKSSFKFLGGKRFPNAKAVLSELDAFKAFVGRDGRNYSVSLGYDPKAKCELADSILSHKNDTVKKIAFVILRDIEANKGRLAQEGRKILNDLKVLYQPTSRSILELKPTPKTLKEADALLKDKARGGLVLRIQDGEHEIGSTVVPTTNWDLYSSLTKAYREIFN